MDLATSFLPLLQVFTLEMTQPTFQTFLTLMAGWLIVPPRTGLSMIQPQHSPASAWTGPAERSSITLRFTDSSLRPAGRSMRGSGGL